MTQKPPFNYDPKSLKRELKPFYISMNEKEEKDILDELGKKELKDVFDHLPKEILFEGSLDLDHQLNYEDLANNLYNISEKNNIYPSFIGEGLKNYKVPSIVSKVCDIRNLTTAYTPYQPERSQGTLSTLWLYASALSSLTGFEAINASLYDRSTCLYEAIQCAIRFKRKKFMALVPSNIEANDLEVLNTLSEYTSTKIQTIKTNSETGLIDLDHLEELIQTHKNDIACLVFPQTNQFGHLENVNLLTDIAKNNDLVSIAIIDPILLSEEGLKKPSQFGSSSEGVDIIVGEGQHLCLGANYGGPGLGIFGIRYNEKNKLMIRNTPGRYISKAQDEAGSPCKVIVLATREQHIRRDKATSNICSNQSFVATIAGAALLQRGALGLKEINAYSTEKAKMVFEKLCQIEGVKPAFQYVPFFHEFTLELPVDVTSLISTGSKEQIHIGANSTDKINRDGQFLTLTITDNNSEEDINKLLNFFEKHIGAFNNKSVPCPPIPNDFLNHETPQLPEFSEKELHEHYISLGEQNVSPDENIYPLGSCTMKYNPYINDWAASLKGFTDIHPSAPIEDCQGSLEVLYETQQWFKKITGLPAVTTQPVAGAQGELVGLKMFQAFHKDNGEGDTRDIILIPKSAHGTNPATATMAGYLSIPGKPHSGIVLIDADENGEIDFNSLTEKVSEFGKRIAGIMVTNPNTTGIFENNFHKMANLIHEVGGLVYMDGANMNAIAGWVDLNKLGVDAVHNNLHKTWTIPHGGGGPGDAIVAVSDKLIDYLPGIQVSKNNDSYDVFRSKKCIGSFHRHHGNFAHKVRALTYLKALGEEGIKKMSAISVLSAQYLFKKLIPVYPMLPKNTENVSRMHEFILTFSEEDFQKIESIGIPRAQSIAKIGKLFLDFGLHAPTVAFPEPLGLMIEPTESYSKAELDRFIEVVTKIKQIIEEHPKVLNTAPHFTPIRKVKELEANKSPVFRDEIISLSTPASDKISPHELNSWNVGQIMEEIISRANQ